MAKTTNTPSKTSRNTNSSNTKKVVTQKKTTSGRTASGSAKKAVEQKPVTRTTRTVHAKKKASPQKTALNRSTSKNTKPSSPSKQSTVSAPFPKRIVQDATQKRSDSGSLSTRTSNIDNKALNTTPSDRTVPRRSDQRSQQKPPLQQWQSQNRPAPNQLPTSPWQEQKSEIPVPPDKEINIKLDQSVAILIDGNNIEMSLHSVSKSTASMINFDKLIPTLLGNRALSRLIYFREGKSISPKLAERLQKMFHGSVVPCHKSADIPLSIKAVQVASKVDTIIILSGDADYVELVRHLKHDGIRVEIAAFPETTADILRQESDYFFPITVDYSFALK